MCRLKGLVMLRSLERKFFLNNNISKSSQLRDSLDDVIHLKKFRSFSTLEEKFYRVHQRQFATQAHSRGSKAFAVSRTLCLKVIYLNPIAFSALDPSTLTFPAG